MFSFQKKAFMKISLSWAFDHIKVDRKEVDIAALVKKLSAKTAEIDMVQNICVQLSLLFAVRVITSNDAEVQVEIPETRATVSLPPRKNAHVGQWYLAAKQGSSFKWAHLTDMGSEKDGLMSEIWIEETDAKGKWRDSLVQEDTILVIDNKALTHRPDLWGHRGFAREIAALLEKELVPEEFFFADISIKHYGFHAPASATHPF
jgi:hypothetical protein